VSSVLPEGGTVLSDTAIRAAVDSGDLAFTDAAGHHLDLDDHQFQPVSVDLRLGAVGQGWSSCWLDIGGPHHWNLPPGAFVLASTLEVVALSDRLAATVEGKSSVARRGLQVEAAGLVDPGFKGQLTLEVVNFSGDWIELTEGQPICQLVLYRVEGRVSRPYGSGGLRSRYQGQMGPTPARED
jgi:dCTP deaminase